MVVAGMVPICPSENGWFRNWTMIVAAETEPPMASAETRAAPAKSAFTLIVIVLVLLLPPANCCGKVAVGRPSKCYHSGGNTASGICGEMSQSPSFCWIVEEVGAAGIGRVWAQ